MLSTSHRTHFEFAHKYVNDKAAAHTMAFSLFSSYFLVAVAKLAAPEDHPGRLPKHLLI